MLDQIGFDLATKFYLEEGAKDPIYIRKAQAKAAIALQKQMEDERDAALRAALLTKNLYVQAISDMNFDIFDLDQLIALRTGKLSLRIDHSMLSDGKWMNSLPKGFEELVRSLFIEPSSILTHFRMIFFNEKLDEAISFRQAEIKMKAKNEMKEFLSELLGINQRDIYFSAFGEAYIYSSQLNEEPQVLQICAPTNLLIAAPTSGETIILPAKLPPVIMANEVIQLPAPSRLTRKPKEKWIEMMKAEGKFKSGKYKSKSIKS